MSRVYTRLRTERGNIPPIWPVCKEYHPRPRRLYLSYLFTGCPVTFAKTVPRDHTQRQPQMETFWNTLKERLEIDRNKVYFYARRTSSLCGCRSEEGRTTAHAGLGWIHVRKTRHRFLNMLRLLCLTLTLDFSLLPTFAFFSGFHILGRGKGKGRNFKDVRTRERRKRDCLRVSRCLKLWWEVLKP